MTRIAEIEAMAAKLSKAERDTLGELSGAWKIVTRDEVRPLTRKGLTAEYRTNDGDYAARLNTNGLAVATYLKDRENG